MKKRLYRSKDERMLTGVLGGIADYFHFDPTIVRLLFFIGVPFTGFFPLVFFYIAAVFIIPKEEERFE
ncbi:PspC domain-containing protein [Aquibacillus koreensis]|uniref:PspC domain-containing protein n=1 Tax=Aquibacillus koreensis TaxID=279446 RepID=A0A9X3WK99_9BACI|nr:PspC domain-containing protein [Aquibacillus koreensis]MCT2537300.1 PspC domain-containing protein [Aquibacillus koreensis]MDC3421647.1 PspC domain-containing protein [Aquibacillus koreensis]